MRSMLQAFWKDETGQDLIEYTLILAFVALASTAIFTTAGGSVTGIWTKANTKLGEANTAIP
jgi:Flp pilus assembly pilin Flp